MQDEVPESCKHIFVKEPCVQVTVLGTIRETLEQNKDGLKNSQYQ